MERICGYSRIFAFLRSATNPPKQLLEVLVSMVTEEEDTMCLKDLKLTVSEWTQMAINSDIANSDIREYLHSHNVFLEQVIC